MMVDEVRYTRGQVPEREALRGLYGAVGWSAYTDDLEGLVRGVEGSAAVVTAWRGEELVGLARVISDGHTIAYLQDVLVRPGVRRQGVASELVRRVFEPFAHVRQQVLLTDAEEGQRAFYASLGFRETREFPNGGLRAFVRLTH
ncbi:GNAT family N-acetyltransferase [Kytococcus sedentarius]|uniref:Acetyltransferase (GNAT) family protein n=1 Tax=Kytococcus sedentarius (strain ATCC 14392 / DSM 20547 / JCM 11482 / CCUG 33030 / NBRC 15357 / NCTC 11040 / CCM 314 / 541) TaxID=478801 RepID=C7NIY7_KYTSD|nr:GNAT family N-acetyltransferase [Kytococcus sedentarius]ACV05212.1 acetyltransferase (GNAT) family protein [Kytococcus sedentarius DSM 20547]QQB63676.1 GNAT family N-acetyltransferase [Kytococcus sedentarius]STX13380.1 Acetyltransferase (GNAT) family [Kytococcus sedentarius]